MDGLRGVVVDQQRESESQWETESWPQPENNTDRLKGTRVSNQRNLHQVSDDEAIVLCKSANVHDHCEVVLQQQRSRCRRDTGTTGAASAAEAVAPKNSGLSIGWHHYPG